MSVFTKTYSNKSNARRAAVKAGLTTFAVVQAEFDGKMVWQIVGEDDLLPTDDVLHASDMQLSDDAFMAPAVALEDMGLHGDGEKCPHCGTNHMVNGYNTFNDAFVGLGSRAGRKQAEKLVDDGFTSQYQCLGCGGMWGPAINLDDYAKQATPATSSTGVRTGAKGVAIQKDRETRNGITRPSVGGKCAAVWAQCDALVAEGTKPMPALLKAWATANGHNPSNAVIEMYQWRKFVA